jgi:hypothetical protein
MSKPNWACSGCGMYSSRRWSVERHILNLHNGNSNVVSFVDYLAGRQSGFYLPKFRPAFVKKNATKTVTVMDTFKDELLKGFASKAVNKALSSSAIQNHQFGTSGAPYYCPSQSYFEPLHIIPRPEDVFGFEIYVCKKCSSTEPIIVSFIDGQEGGSKMGWATCCSSSDLKKVDQKTLIENNELQLKIQNKLKYCVDIWTKKPSLVAIKIPQPFHGTALKLLGKDDKQSISLEYSSEKNIELDIDDENHWAPRCVRAGIIPLSDEELSDFLNKGKNATYGFFKVMMKEPRNSYLLLISTSKTKDFRLC